MVSINQNIFYKKFIYFLFFCHVFHLGKCLPPKSASNEKYIKRNFDWNSHRPDLKANVTKTWLKLDKKTAQDNSKAEEVADPNESEVNSRFPNKDRKRIVLSPTNCGHSENTRLVGGKDAPNHAYPWIVVVVRYGQPICAGNIINRYWVVTAGHCFIKNNSTDSLFIRIGTNYSNKGARVKVAKVFIHPRFNVDNMYNSDISLIKLSTPLKMDTNVRAICLPKYTYVEPSQKNVMVAGWGAKAFVTALMPIQLQEIKLPIISTKNCINRYRRKRITIYKSQLCTWAKAKDACRGDSGGPAVQYEKGRAYLIGMVSFGITCADRYPGIFTKVSYFLQWIQYTINRNTKKKKKIKIQNDDQDSLKSDKKKKKKKKKLGISLGGKIQGGLQGGFNINLRNKGKPQSGKKRDLIYDHDQCEEEDQ